MGTGASRKACSGDLGPSPSHAALHQLAHRPPFRLSRICPCDGHILRGGDLGKAASSPRSLLEAAPLGRSPATRLVDGSHDWWTADGARPGLHWAWVWGAAMWGPLPLPNLVAEPKDKVQPLQPLL